MIWVIDASVAVRWFISEEVHMNAEEVLKALVDNPRQFAVPELFAFEVYAVLQRLHPNGLHAFLTGVIPLLQGGVFRQPMTEHLAAAANCFVQKGLTGYDACYAALAEELNAAWLTFDEKAHRFIKKENLSFLLTEGLPDGWVG